MNLRNKKGMGGRSRQISEFKASLIYKVSSRIARATQRNPVLEKKKKKEEEKKNQSSCSIVWTLVIWGPGQLSVLKLCLRLWRLLCGSVR
jgi:hypothetical protein